MFQILKQILKHIMINNQIEDPIHLFVAKLTLNIQINIKQQLSAI